MVQTMGIGADESNDPLFKQLPCKIPDGFVFFLRQTIGVDLNRNLTAFEIMQQVIVICQIRIALHVSDDGAVAVTNHLL